MSDAAGRDVSRSRRGRSSCASPDVRLDEVLAALESMAAPQMAAKRLKFSQFGCADASARADLEKLQQVLLNLLTDAIRFTAAEGGLELGCAEEDEWMILSVRDSGRGIAADQLEATSAVGIGSMFVARFPRAI